MSLVSLQQVDLAYRYYKRPYHALMECFSGREHHETFYALQDINLELAPGVALGVVGDNGAGKSTLLRLLAGNLQPSNGDCHIRGTRSALLELGVGVHPELSGVENIRMGLAMRGLSTYGVAEAVFEVAEFAELGDFLHKPVKQYSSGMLVRLLFAVAVHIKPDLLIVDEALAVGDQYFQKKSLDRMRAILEQGTTLVFCSHNLYQVREICQQALWLEKGHVRLCGEAQVVVDAYQDAVRLRSAHSGNARNTETESIAIQPQEALAQPQVAYPKLMQVTLQGGQFDTESRSGELRHFTTGEYFAVKIEVYTASQPLSDVHVGIVLRRNDDIQCFGISTLHDGMPLHACGEKQAMTRFVLEKLPLLSGQYCLEVWLIDSSGVHVYDARERCCHFAVQQPSKAQGIGVSWMAHRWEAEDGLCVS